MRAKFLPMTTLAFAFTGALFLGACSKKSGNDAGGGGSGEGTFSVTIDGKTITGTDKFNNADLVIAADPNASFDPQGDIFLAMQAQGDSIGVHLPDRTGVTSVGDTGTYAAFYGVITLPDGAFIFAPVHVNVTSLTSTRIIGTFSGTVDNSLLPGGKTHTLTNGSFNLPRIN